MNTVFSPLSSHGRSLVLAAAAAIVVLAAGGCAMLKPAESESHYHVLTAITPSAMSNPHNQMASGCVICLRPVEVANYLETKNMAVRTGTNEVTYALFHRWAEPLNAGVRRVLGEDLRRSPEIRSVITDQPVPARGPIYTVWVRVLACEGAETNHHGSAVFEAAWEITRPGLGQDVIAHGVFQTRPTDWRVGDYGQLANQLSKALGDFSRALSDAIPQTAD